MPIVFFAITSMLVFGVVCLRRRVLGERLRAWLDGRGAVPVALVFALCAGSAAALWFGLLLPRLLARPAAGALYALVMGFAGAGAWAVLAAPRPRDGEKGAATHSETSDTAPTPGKADAARPADGPPVTLTQHVFRQAIGFERQSRETYRALLAQDLPDSVLSLFGTFAEDKDDHLARLEAALRRHEGEEILRSDVRNVPDIRFPDFSTSRQPVEIRELVQRQEDAALMYYREVAKYALKPSVKHLFAALALDGQRHVSLASQICD
ncbi:MAG: ferritin family protein [Lentisphaeria bacterium]|nr:ferritin family protein [Lentisphaeria bacterium]